MEIPVVLKNGHKLSVDKDRFQFLLFSEQLLFFKRLDGWVSVGRDELRNKAVPYQGEERRSIKMHAKNYWY